MRQVVPTLTAKDGLLSVRAVRAVYRARVPRSNGALERAPLQRALQEFVDHYHRERNHQGIESRLVELLRASCVTLRRQPARSTQMWDTTGVPTTCSLAILRTVFADHKEISKTSSC
jgi:hypothetical protein